MNVLDLGTMDFAACFALQKDLLEKVATGQEPDTLLLVEHPPVITTGASFKPEHLLTTPEELKKQNIQLETIDRGGDVTYHGPGQLVAYPIFNLTRHGKDLHKWMRELEETVIQTLAHYNLPAKRFPPNTGVWIEDRKVCAIGVKVRKWTSMHGLALNCNNDLTPFNLIVPCGIHDYGVTSLTQELNRKITTEEVKPLLTQAFRNLSA